RVEVAALAGEAAGGERGDVAGGPDLTVRVRVAAAHHLDLVLEYLHVGDVVPRPEPRRLVGPRVHDQPDLGRRHEGQRQIVPGRKAQHAAESADRARDQDSVGCFDGRLRSAGDEGREVVVEGEGRRVGGGARAVGARVAGTQIAGGIAGREAL